MTERFVTRCAECGEGAPSVVDSLQGTMRVLSSLRELAVQVDMMRYLDGMPERDDEAFEAHKRAAYAALDQVEL